MKKIVDRLFYFMFIYGFLVEFFFFVEKLREIVLFEGVKVVFGLSGSDVNDGVIKFVRVYIGRCLIIGYFRSYYGFIYGVMSVIGFDFEVCLKVG